MRKFKLVQVAIIDCLPGIPLSQKQVNLREQQRGRVEEIELQIEPVHLLKQKPINNLKTNTDRQVAHQ